MLTDSIDKPALAWKTTNLLLFRFFFLYFLIHLLPTDRDFLNHLAFAWKAPLHYPAIFNLVNYAPYSFANSANYSAWGIIALLSMGGAVIWTKLDHGRIRHYSTLHYWLRVLLRYKLSSVLLTYGFLLIFTLWAPYPSISQLNTRYGDITPWKHFTLSLSVSPFYQFFLGSIEVIAGLLLVYRKTVPFAAFIAILFLGNVYVSNLAYEGSLAKYSLHLIIIGLFLLIYDVRQFVCLLILQRATEPHPFKSVMFSRRQQRTKAALKTSFLILFIVFYGFNTGIAHYHQRSYRLPSKTGLPGWEGLYNVTEFRCNDSILPFDRDTIRWQDVVFEKWNTVSIGIYAKLLPYPDAPDGFISTHNPGHYEFGGSTGRYYYSYEVDTLQHLLILKNRASYDPSVTIVLNYVHQSPTRLFLNGIFNNRDSITVILDKIDKKYLLEEAAKTGRKVPIKL